MIKLNNRDTSPPSSVIQSKPSIEMNRQHPEEDPQITSVNHQPNESYYGETNNIDAINPFPSIDRSDSPSLKSRTLFPIKEEDPHEIVQDSFGKNNKTLQE